MILKVNEEAWSDLRAEELPVAGEKSIKSFSLGLHKRVLTGGAAG